MLWMEQFWNGHPRKLDREILKIAFPRKLDPSKISRYTVLRGSVSDVGDDDNSSNVSDGHMSVGNTAIVMGS